MHLSAEGLSEATRPCSAPTEGTTASELLWSRSSNQPMKTHKHRRSQRSPGRVKFQLPTAMPCLGTQYLLATFLSLSCFPILLPQSMSSDYHPNMLPALQSLSKHLLLGKPILWQNFKQNYICIWSCSLSAGYNQKKKISISKIYLHSCVHYSFIHNYQIQKQPKGPSVDEWIKKK